MRKITREGSLWNLELKYFMKIMMLAMHKYDFLFLFFII